jgi:phage gp36-like protein
MSTAYGSGPPGLIGTHYGGAGLGVLGSSIPSSGLNGPSILYPGLVLPAEANDEFMLRILTVPAGLTLFTVDEYGRVQAEGPDGLYTGTYDAARNGVFYGPSTYSIAIGPQVTVSGGYVLADLVAGGGIGFAPALLGGGFTLGTVVASGFVHQADRLTRYATPQAYIQRFGLDEAVQLLADEQGLLTAGLLQDAIGESWTGTPSDAEQLAALDALSRLERALASTSSFMDGYLRTAAALPLAANDANAGTLQECCLALTRCDVADDSDNSTTRMDNTAERWRGWLNDVARRRVQLVGITGDVPDPSRGTRSGQARSNIGWDGFGGMR